MSEKVKPYESDDDLESVTRRRRESEPSTENSQYTQEDIATELTTHRKTYGFYYTKSHLNIKVCDEQKNVIYFGDFSSFSSAPDLVLHQGVDTHAPIVAVARFRWSRHLKLGFGNPHTSEKDVVWENMENVSRGVGHSKYRVEMTINDDRRSFLWQRTRDPAHGVQGAGKMINWNYTLVDETTGQVLAVYLENFWKSWQKKGKLQLREDLGKEWELMVLLGSLGLCEKASRRGRYRSGAAAGGSGGG